MNRNKLVLELIENRKASFKKNYGRYYPDSEGNASFFLDKKRRLYKKIKQDKWLIMDDYLVSFSDWYIAYSQYARMQLDDKKLQKNAFCQSAWCSYKAMKVKTETARIRGIKKGPNTGFLPWQVLSWYGNLLLAGWQVEADEIMNLVLASKIGSPGIILDGGSTLDTFVFFLMELYCLWQGKTFRRGDFRHTAIYRKEFGDDVVFIYDPMLENWSTTDSKLLDNLVTQMCDYHVSRTVEQPKGIPKDEEDYYEFNRNAAHQLYPFEVLVWLKIRELAGLKNPSEFFHPLMNQPLAEPITDAPLKKPIEHEETNQILSLVLKHFPDAQL